MTRDRLVAQLAAAMQDALGAHPATIRLATEEGPTPTGVLLAETALDTLTGYIDPLL